MILYIASLIIFIFVAFNLFWRAGCPMWLKIAGSAFLLFASMKQPIYRVLGGNFFSPDLPRWFIMTMEGLYGALLVLFFLLLLWDIYLFGNWLLARTGIPVPRHLPKGAIKCGLVFLALALGLWGTLQAVKVPEPRLVEMRLPNLPQGLDGFSIVQLSDIHLGPVLRRPWLEQVVERANALNPDIIALTGDYVDGTVAELENELEPLSLLKAKYGVFGVTGNHEYYWNAAQWTKAMKNMGLDMLENEHRNVSVNGENIVVAGLPDVVASRFGHEGPDIAKALDGAPEGLRLLLMHHPKTAPEYSSSVDVQLSGHTHGGVMFFLRPLIAAYNNGFVQGGYDVNGKKLYVHPGTGIWNGMLTRIGAPSEITKIILRKGN